MPTFTSQQLMNRDKIIQSQKQFITFLNKDIIISLISLFNTNNIYGDKIINYINDERKKRKMNPAIRVESEVNLRRNNDPTLHLSIKNNNTELLHFSIHLVLGIINPKLTGIIHIQKNIYKSMTPKPEKKSLYALISVRQPINKPNSLEFSIDDGYVTPGVKNSHIYDPDLQKEMNVIIDVMNNIFDETKPNFYIGNPHKLFNVHKKSNNILQKINNHNIYATRKNKGSLIIPYSNTLGPNNLGLIIKKSKINRTTRKIRRTNIRHKQKNIQRDSMVGSLE